MSTDSTIDAALDTASPLSEIIEGQHLARSSHAMNALAGIQVQRIPDSGSYEVHLEAAAPILSGVPLFKKIGEFSDGEDGQISAFPVITKALYRVRHVSGAACRVWVGG